MRHLLFVTAVALLTAVALVLLTGSPASASIAVNVSSTMPETTFAGDQNGVGSLTFSNQNDVQHQNDSQVVGSIRFSASCGSPFAFSNLCSTPDPGVFALSPTAIGSGGACMGVLFTVSAPNTNGVVTLTPTVGEIVLSPPGSANDYCRLDFSFDVLKVPAIDVSGAAGVQTFSNAFVSVEAAFAMSTTPITCSRPHPR